MIVPRLSDRFVKDVKGMEKLLVYQHCIWSIFYPSINIAITLTRHTGMFLAGLNLPGADLNSQRLVRRMKYMDVFHNPVSLLRTEDAGCLPAQA